jgi:hypothetical protein
MLEFELKGSGQPVLLIHGSHLARSYLPLVAQKSLAEACLLIRYHRRGRRDSPAAPHRRASAAGFGDQADPARAGAIDREA